MRIKGIIWISLLSILSISCEKTDNLSNGKVLFCTNAHMIDCVFSIDISIDGKKIGTLDASSEYFDSECYCENSIGIGLLTNMEGGTYNYTAKETNCNATNITSLWDGKLTIKADSCTVVFLDILIN